MEDNKIKDLDGEVWRPVVGYEDIYECSNLGRIKSHHRRKEYLMQGKHDKNGYLTVRLTKDGKAKFFQAHRVIGQAFIPNLDKLPEINHLNEIKDDNRAENLEWCTHYYNMHYGSRTKKAAQSQMKPVQCVETGVIYPSATHAIQTLGLKASRQGIQSCVKGRQKTCGGYHWIYPKESENDVKTKAV